MNEAPSLAERPATPRWDAFLRNPLLRFGVDEGAPQGALSLPQSVGHGERELVFGLLHLRDLAQSLGLDFVAIGAGDAAAQGGGGEHPIGGGDAGDMQYGRHLHFLALHLLTEPAGSADVGPESSDEASHG